MILLAATATAVAKNNELGVAEWAGIVGACFAGVAAVAALATVVQNRLLLTTTLRPFLHDVIVDKQERPILEVHNAGGGVALTVRFVWTHAGRTVGGDLISALATGEHATVVAAVSKEDLIKSHGAITWEDVRGNAYASSLDSHYERKVKHWWRRERLSLDPRQAYERFYGTSPDAFEEGEWRFARPLSAAFGYEPFDDDA